MTGLAFAATIPERGFDVTLDVPAGRTLALLGPNGAGKSTLLAAAAGLLRPATARILLDGRPLTVEQPGPGHADTARPRDRRAAARRHDGDREARPRHDGDHVSAPPHHGDDHVSAPPHHGDGDAVPRHDGDRDARHGRRGPSAARTWVPPHARGIGLLAQDPRLFPHLSVLDNVAFGPRSAGATRAAARAAAHHWLAEVGVIALADRRPAQLSGGQAQRVAIARALAAQPRLVLLDEPLAALDVDAAPAVRHLLHRVLAGRTAVVATHDVLDALLLADDVAVLDGGRVVEHGPTHEVLRRPRSAFAARIAGLNLLTGTWDGTALRTADGLLVRGMPGEPPGVDDGHAPPDHTVRGSAARRPDRAGRAPGADGPRGGMLVPGAAAVAVFRPAAVAVHTTPVGGSPRNAVVRTVTVLEPHGDLIRVRCGDLAADITPGAATELALVPGTEVHLVVKAAEVQVYAA